MLLSNPLITSQPGHTEGLAVLPPAQPNLSHRVKAIAGLQSKQCLAAAGTSKMTQDRAVQSGAAASSAALVQALHGLFVLLCITLSDSITPSGMVTSQSGQRAEPQAVANSADALSALEALAVSSSSSALAEQPGVAENNPTQKAAQVKISSPPVSSHSPSPSIVRMQKA